MKHSWPVWQPNSTRASLSEPLNLRSYSSGNTLLTKPELRVHLNYGSIQLYTVIQSYITALQATVKELTSQLARVEPLSRTGKSSVLYLLTREAADEEKRDLVNEVNNWKDVVQEKDAVIADKNKRIAELEQLGELSSHLLHRVVLILVPQSEIHATNSMSRSKGPKL